MHRRYIPGSVESRGVPDDTPSFTFGIRTGSAGNPLGKFFLSGGQGGACRVGEQRSIAGVYQLDAAIPGAADFIFHRPAGT